MKEESPSFSQTIASYRVLFTHLKNYLRQFWEIGQQRNGFFFDLFLTGVFCAFWLFFSWQHGFSNSPDSWYRGILGKSLAEGRPYFVNIKQGWLYAFGPWHHDATHSPLLPLLYAAFFLLLGNRIIIANLIAALSAGLLLWPLLRLSRNMLGTPFAGGVIYLLSAFNPKNDFLFEVFAGLSIPTTLMLLAFFYYFLWSLLKTGRKNHFWGAVISLAAFFYIRPGEQVVFAWLFFWSLIFGAKFLPAEKFKRVAAMWIWTALFAAPWLIRNLLLFGQPFFTHTTPALWADRGYDYWTYHEHLPFPTAAAYFKNHSLFDFLSKLFVRGPGNYLSIFGQTLSGPLWLYFLALLAALIVIFKKTAGGAERFFFFTLANSFVAYSIVYCLVPVLDKRYMMLPFFLMAFPAVVALFFIFNQSKGSARTIFYAGLLLLVFLLQTDFWLGGFAAQFNFSFSTADGALRADPLISGLKRKINQTDIVLGPFADVQRLNFATGLTLIEEPDNLRALDNPAAFFRKYQINYSLVDVAGLLPESMIEKTEMVGNRLLYKINLSAVKTPKEDELAIPIRGQPEKQVAIRRGIRRKNIFVDAYHGGELESTAALRKQGAFLFTSSAQLAANPAALFNSGILLIKYKIGGRELSEPDLALVKQFIAGGGRLFLLCPAWVWYSYDKKGIELSPYYRLAREFGLTLTGEQIPMQGELEGVFSKILFRRGKILLAGPQKEALAVYAEKGKSRIILWGQNNLLSEKFLRKEGNQKYLSALLDYLWRP